MTTTHPAATKPPTVQPALSAQSRGDAVAISARDPRVKALTGGHLTVVRVASWTRAVPNASAPFIGVLVTLELVPARSVDAVWPSWACRAASQGVDGVDDGRGVGTTVHVVAENVSQLLVGVDLTTNRVLFLEPDAESHVRTWLRVGISDSFPLMKCDDDDPQL